MTINILISAAVAVVVATLLYKVIPFRTLPEFKPGFSLFPKYRTSIQWASAVSAESAIEECFAESGFKLIRSDQHTMRYQRGHLLGDFSLKRTRLRCTISVPENGSSTLAVEAGWLIAFDTGDLWTFTSELKRNLQTAAIQTDR